MNKGTSWVLMTALACLPWTAAAQTGSGGRVRRLASAIEKAMAPRAAEIVRECEGAVALQVLVTDMAMTASCARDAAPAAEASARIRLSLADLNAENFAILRLEKERPAKECLPERWGDCSDAAQGFPVLLDALNVDGALRAIREGGSAGAIEDAIVLQFEIDQAFREALRDVRLRAVQAAIAESLEKTAERVTEGSCERR